MNNRLPAILIPLVGILFWGFSSTHVVFGATPTTAPSADDDIDSLPVKAPNVGSITHRTTTGARDGPAFDLFLFSPGQAGATVKEHPTFYWYLAQKNEDDTEVVVTEIETPKPGGKPVPKTIIMRKKYTGMQRAGIYAATLDDAALQPEKLYQISVVVHLSSDNDPTKKITSMGYVVRYPDSSAPSDADDPVACAKAGLWYDAIDAAMRHIAHNPQSPGPHKQLHALLRGEHVLNAPATDKPGDVASAKQKESEFFHRLETSYDALIMTKPPEKSPGKNE